MAESKALDWLLDARWFIAGMYFCFFLFFFWVNYDFHGIYYARSNISLVLYQTVFAGTLIVIAFLVLIGVWSLIEAFEGEPSNTDEQSFILLYIASFLIPVAGIIIGAIYLINHDKKVKDAGSICLFIGILSLLIYWFFVFSMFF